MKILKNASTPALPFIVTDNDGNILRVGSAPGDLVDIQANKDAGEHVFIGYADDSIDYIDVVEGAIVKKHQMNLSVINSTISGIPPQCVITVEGVEYALTENSITLEFNLVGEYIVKLVAPKYLNEIVKVIQL